MMPRCEKHLCKSALLKTVRRVYWQNIKDGSVGQPCSACFQFLTLAETVYEGFVCVVPHCPH